MRKILFCTIIASACSCGLLAQSKMEKISELMHLMRNDSAKNAMIENMSGIFATGDFHKSKDPRKDSIYNVFVQEQRNAFLKKTTENSEKKMVELYDQHFTLAEIQVFIDFYKTPEAQKWLAVSPAIQKELVASIMTNDMQEFKASMKKKLEELYPGKN